MTNNFTKVINGIKIDPVIFTFKFSCRCSGECCHYGVYTDLKEHDKIISIKDKIFPLLDESQTKDISKWFEAQEKDEDFESGVAVGTELHNGKCVFLDEAGLCTLQKLALIEGKHKWEYKPLYCILFPLTIFEGALTIDDEHIDRLKTCNKSAVAVSGKSTEDRQDQNGMSIYEACREELQHFLGKEGFEELEKYKQESLNNVLQTQPALPTGIQAD